VIFIATTERRAETDEYREVLAAVINGVLTWAREEEGDMHE
jgi:hypothetical protein